MKWLQLATSTLCKLLYALYRKMTQQEQHHLIHIHPRLSTFIGRLQPTGPACRCHHQCGRRSPGSCGVDPLANFCHCFIHYGRYGLNMIKLWKEHERIASLPCLELVSKSVTGDLPRPKGIQGATMHMLHTDTYSTYYFTSIHESSTSVPLPCTDRNERTVEPQCLREPKSCWGIAETCARHPRWFVTSWPASWAIRLSKRGYSFLSSSISIFLCDQGIFRQLRGRMGH